MNSQPGDLWWMQMVSLVFPQALCRWIWINTHTIHHEGIAPERCLWVTSLSLAYHMDIKQMEVHNYIPQADNRVKRNQKQYNTVD